MSSFSAIGRSVAKTLHKTLCGACVNFDDALYGNGLRYQSFFEQEIHNFLLAWTEDNLKQILVKIRQTVQKEKRKKKKNAFFISREH